MHSWDHIYIAEKGRVRSTPGETRAAMVDMLPLKVKVLFLDSNIVISFVSPGYELRRSRLAVLMVLYIEKGSSMFFQCMCSEVRKYSPGNQTIAKSDRLQPRDRKVAVV